ncbi:hypothetical protein [Leptolyngbya sp. FACHB-261]|uniref:hypothetical protein n=1 Tax=Leptolyngbya sp. FACHB-261 TaxID=2692806 RepID=UPI0016895163|nr:hypothetical protein [Leptolyngbya sp. FACHB-261]MBD2100052.1 hypothetical protein [Leptolyngbya sp. FACHB-261]
MAQTQKQGRPNDQQPDEWQQDLNPNPQAGQNTGLESSSSEKDSPNAFEIKELHQYLEGYNSGDLKKIRVLPTGTRLQQGAKYLDLKDPERKEFTAMGNMEAGPDNWYVPKSEMDYPLWNRLTGVQEPERLDEPSET